MIARPRLFAALAGLMLLTAACGSSLTDAEILRANGVRTTEVTTAEDTPTIDEGGDLTTDDTLVSGETTGTTIQSLSRSTTTLLNKLGTPGETGPIILGSVGNYSGPAGAAQVGFPKAVQVWAAGINAKGGLFGRQVKVIVQDDGGDPARYASAVQDLVENRGVIAFVGQAAVLSVRGGAKYLAEHHIPVIGTDCSAPEWYIESDNLFPQCADSTGQSISYIAAGVKLTGKHRLGFVFCGESPTCTANAPLYEGANSKRAGATTVYKAQISIAQVDFTSNCQAAQEAKVEIMAVLADPGTLARFVRSCDRQGFKPSYLGVSISALPDTVKLPGLSRLVLGVPSFPFAGASSPAIKEYDTAMRRYLGADPGPAESAGWVAAKLFELAANRAAAASKSLSSKTLLTAMHTVKGETLGGLTVALDFTGKKPTTPPCAFVLQGDGNGGWEAPYNATPQCIPGT